MKKQLKKILLPLLLSTLPIYANATPDINIIIGKMEVGQEWAVEVQSPAVSATIVGKWYTHTATMDFGSDTLFNDVSVSYCIGPKRSCIPEMTSIAACTLIDQTQGKDVSAKITVYLDPSRDSCRAVKSAK